MSEFRINLELTNERITNTLSVGLARSAAFSDRRYLQSDQTVAPLCLIDDHP